MRNNIKLLGDPHMGRQFVHGVPLHRRGEREESMWRDLHESLNNVNGYDYHICMGDIFDSFNVPREVVIRSSELYLDASSAHSGVKYVVLRGNHDAVRDRDRVSSFDVFAALMAPYPNIIVVKDEPVWFDGMAFVPWHPFYTAEEMAQQLPVQSFDAVYGHWDVEEFGDYSPNMIPVEELRTRAKIAYTGHVHTPCEMWFDGFPVIVTGSMQPYTHGEDPRVTRYVTMTLNELDEVDFDFKDMCIRLLLKPGQRAPDDLDCAQLTIKRVTEDKEEATVELESFDMKTLFDEAMNEEKVKPEFAKKIWERYND